MSKAFGIIAIVLGIWVAMELYTEGAQNALGGAVSFLAEDEGDDPRAGMPVTKRAGLAVEDAHAEAAERRNRLMAE